MIILCTRRSLSSRKRTCPLLLPHSATKGITKGVVDKRQIALTLSTVSLASAIGRQDLVKYRTVEAGKVDLTLTSQPSQARQPKLPNSVRTKLVPAERRERGVRLAWSGFTPGGFCSMPNARLSTRINPFQAKGELLDCCREILLSSTSCPALALSILGINSRLSLAP